MSFGIDRAGLWLARTLSSFWVKPHRVPANPLALGLEPGAPLFYVIETRSLANLLVVERVCIELGLARPTEPYRLALDQTGGEFRLKNAVAAAISWRGWLSRKPNPRYSASLRSLIETAQRNPDLAPQLVPVAVFFGRRPDRERSSFKLLFSDSSIHVGRVRKFFIVLLHGRNTWVQFGAPVDLGAFVAQSRGLSGQRATRKLSRLFRVYFRQQRAAAVGPDLSQLHQLVQELLRRPSVQRAIRDEGGSPARAAARARRYAYEIAADFSYPFILFMRRALRRLWDKLYDGVETYHIETLQHIAPGRSLIYLPCHRSHIDYLLLSYVLHAHGLAIPHVAAGVNLNLPVVGAFLRRGGGFFLRRTFRGQPLYAAVFLAYLSTILSKGFAVEYFIEGGRSRTGLSLRPRPGMLDMTVRSFLAERGRPAVFVPVYIGYEKLVEGRSFQAELGGAKKQKESLLSLFKGLKTLRSEFGKVHVSIGEPIDLETLLDSHRPGWRDEAVALDQRPDWLPPLIDELSRRAVTEINAAVVVNPINLLALALLAAPRRALAEPQLEADLGLYLALLRRWRYSSRLTLTALEPAQIIAHGLSLEMIGRAPHPLGAIISVDAVAAARLRYFANNALHALALPSLLGCCFQNTEALSGGQIRRLCGVVYPLLHQDLFLATAPQRLDAALDAALETFCDLGLLQRDGDRYRRADTGAGGQRLRRLAAAVQDSVERFFLLLTLLLQRGSGVLDESQLVETCSLQAQRLTMLYVERPPEFAAAAAFRPLLASLREREQLWTDAAGRLCFDDSLAALYDDASLMLPEAFRHDVSTATGANGRRVADTR